MKTSLRFLSLFLAVSLIFGAGYFAGTSTPTLQTQAQQPPETELLFEPFWEAWQLVQNRFLYIDRVDQTALMEGALNGMIAVLGDENTGYMNPEAYTQVTSGMQGEYEGIGATVRKDETTGGVLIVSTTAGSPAREQLRQGDVILKVGDQDVTGISLAEAVNLIRGPSGTAITLSVLREGRDDLLTVTVKRARIKREIVTSALYEGNIGYVSLASFNETSGDDLRAALIALDANNLDGLILDMRNDPGGYLETAISVASLFLDDGPVLIQKGRPGTREIVFETNQRAVAPDVPLVVLLNEASASASELVAGALQDRGRAKVVGTVSFGKGSIQQWSGLSNGGGIRITIAEFTKPSGDKINKIGIIPDVLVPWNEAQMMDNPAYDPQLTEALWLLRGEF